MARSFYGRSGVEFKDTMTGNLVKLSRAIRTKVRLAVLAGAELVKERAHDLANVSPGVQGHAVDGGHMRDKIEVHLLESPTSVEARVGVSVYMVPYVAHQEFGPNGKPFLRPALDESRQEIHQLMRDVVFNGADPRTFVRFRSGGMPTGEVEE